MISLHARLHVFCKSFAERAASPSWQAFVLNPFALGLVHISAQDFERYNVSTATWPLPASQPNAFSQWVFQFSNFFRLAPHKRSTLFRECFPGQQEDDPIYRCRSLKDDAEWRTGGIWDLNHRWYPDFSCEDAESVRVQKLWQKKGCSVKRP